MHSVWDTVFDFDPETVPIRSPSPERTSPSSRRTLARVAKVVPVISPSSQPTALSYPRSPNRLSPDESLSQRVEIRGERLGDVLRARGHLQQSPRLPRVPHAHVAQRGANVRRRSAVPSESARGGRPAARETCGVSPQAFLPPSQDAKRRAKQTESKRGGLQLLFLRKSSVEVRARSGRGEESVVRGVRRLGRIPRRRQHRVRHRPGGRGVGEAEEGEERLVLQHVQVLEEVRYEAQKVAVVEHFRS